MNRYWLIFRKSEYLILSCIGFCNEHTSSFIELTEGEANLETDELFYTEFLPIIKGE